MVTCEGSVDLGELMVITYVNTLLYVGIDWDWSPRSHACSKTFPNFFQTRWSSLVGITARTFSPSYLLSS